ncbi:MAG: ABC transporter ATP-binding protein [Ignisphaera sp.]
MDMNNKFIIMAKNLEIGYETDDGIIWAVRGVSFSVTEKTSFCLVGESGSGKSSIGNAISGLLPPYSITKGVLIIDNKYVVDGDKTDFRSIRGAVVRIPQNPSAALSPYAKISDVFMDIIRNVFGRINRERGIEIMKRYLQMVNLSEDVLNMYPYQLSGGMAQRLAIAMSLSINPRIIVADEPTSNLDAYLRGAIGNILKELVNKGITLIVITHDILFASHVCKYIAVMYRGKIVEIGRVDEILSNPIHPYTIELIEAATLQRGSESKKISTIVSYSSRGCTYLNRCPFAFSKCNEEPKMVFTKNDHGVACWKVERLYA